MTEPAKDAFSSTGVLTQIKECMIFFRNHISMASPLMLQDQDSMVNKADLAVLGLTIPTKLLARGNGGLGGSAQSIRLQDDRTIGDVG